MKNSQEFVEKISNIIISLELVLIKMEKELKNTNWE